MTMAEGMAPDAIAHYKEFLIILGAAGLAVPFLLRLGISTSLGFLLVGFVLGPNVLGRIVGHVPFAQALVITNPESIRSMAELGVVFLMFLIGLELSLERLKLMRRLVFGLGGLQVLLSGAVITLVAVLVGYAPAAAVVLGMALALSSTAIVIQIYSDAKRLGSNAGRASFAILLLQDLAVIPIMLTVLVLGRNAEGSMLQSLVTGFAQAALAIIFIYVVGRRLLRPVLRRAASAHSSDLFVAAVLLIVVGTAALANLAGLSMALGAFIAGLLLAETEYRRAIEAVIEPFKGLLLGAFFLLVGMGLDLAGLTTYPLLVVSSILGLIAIKAAITYGLARAFGLAPSASLETALVIGPGGEFAFVILSAAAAAGIIDHSLQAKALLVVSVTMVLIPLLYRLARRLIRAMPMASTIPATAQAAPPPDPYTNHVIIAGFGRVGHLIGSMLDEHQIPYIAVDNDPALVTRERKGGFPVYFGDAANPVFLAKCGLDAARALAVTMDSPSRVDEVTRAARAEHKNLKIIARARDERHAMALYLSGASEAVPETIESSLQLGESILVEAGVPVGLAIASIHERRDGFRKMLGRPDRRAQRASQPTLRKRAVRRKPTNPVAKPQTK